MAEHINSFERLMIQDRSESDLRKENESSSATKTELAKKGLTSGNDN